MQVPGLPLSPKCHFKAKCSSIALFTDDILYLHYSEIERECQAILGKTAKIA